MIVEMRRRSLFNSKLNYHVWSTAFNNVLLLFYKLYLPVLLNPVRTVSQALQ
jgi:hypothetical protein